MNALQYFVCSVVIGAIAWWRGWYGLFHLVLGGVALALGFLAAFLWRRSCREDGEEDHEVGDPDGVADSPFRAVFLASLSGLAVSAYLGLVFAGAGRLDGLVRLFYDGDRKPFEARLELLAQAGQHEQVVELIKARLAAGRVSHHWRVELIRRQAGSMLEAADQASAGPDRLQRLEAAIAFASANHVDAHPAERLLQRERERHQARTELERLQAAGDWPQLTASLRFLLASRSRLDWVVPADQWLYDAYVAWARNSSNLPVRQERLELALQVAADFGLDPSAATALRESTEQQATIELSVQRAREEGSADARGKAQAEIARLNELKAMAEADRLRDQAAAAASRDQRDQEAAAQLARAEREARYRALIESGDCLEGTGTRQVLEQRLKFHTEALAFARASGLDPEPASTRLARTRDELNELLTRLQQASCPADLPPGARVQILYVGTDRFPPGLDVAVAVEDAQGQTIASLVAKDFRVTCAGEVLTNLSLALVQPELPLLHVIVALDVSGSMSGRPLAAGIAAAQAMIRSLGSEPGVRVKVLTFSGKVQVRCPWTHDLEQAARSVAGLTSSGQTALLAALESALTDLEACVGDRRLVVLSDGKDNQSSLRGSLPGLLARLGEAKVVASVIGLESAELDRTALEQLATGTRGSYYHAAAPEEVAMRFGEARRQLRREFYRLLLTPSLTVGTSSFEVRVEVGGANRAVDQTTVYRKPGAAVATR